jgi:lipoprotein signal peptidase
MLAEFCPTVNLGDASLCFGAINIIFSIIFIIDEQSHRVYA